MAREPLYKKAEREMLARIADGRWPVGTRLGNEFVLAEEFGVSQGTMRRALITLEQMGHLGRKPGRGTEVTQPTSARSGVMVTLALPDGSTPVFDIFRSAKSTRRPGEEDRAFFGPSRLHVITRTLTTDDERSALEEIIIPEDHCPVLPPDLPALFTDLLYAADLHPDAIEESIGAAVTTMGESVALQCARSTALLCLTRTAQAADGTSLARQELKIALPGLTCRLVS